MGGRSTGIRLARSAIGLADRIEALARGGGGRGGLAPPAEVGRMIVWSMDRIGDVQRATPAIRLLARRYPGAEMHAVVAARAAPVLAANPHLAAVHEIAAIHDPRAHLALLRKLKGPRWDFAVLLEVDRFWAKLGQWWSRALGVPVWAGFDLGNAAAPGAILVPLGAGSWTDQFVALAAALGAEDDGRGMELFVTPEERDWARAFLAERGIADGAPFFLIHPGGGAEVVSRQWPPERFAALVDLLAAQWGWPVVATGAGAERAVVERIRAAAATPVLDLCDRLTLRRLAAVIERSACCIMNDTGPLHMANALGRPTVAILGPTAPEVVGIPETGAAVFADLPCRPCAHLSGWTACANPDQWACLRAVAPEDVARAVAERLRHRDRSGGTS